MSWRTGSLISLREQFVLLVLARGERIVRLCRRFHIGRTTGYKWVRRYQQHGRAGLSDQSRRPRRSPRQLTLCWQRALRQLRRRHPTWGPLKLRARLRQLHPRVRLPSARTLGRWLCRWQLVSTRPRHQRRGPELPPLVRTVARAANDVWTVDFKGWFRTGDGTRVEPLTVRDLKSCFLLAVRLLPNQSDVHARRAMRSLFQRYGLPRVIRVDNGAPFGGVGPLGLSRLSVWWRRLGIRVEFSRPARPGDNAAHEQMHQIYQAEVAATPGQTPRAHQRRSDRWRKTYNDVRPHQKLGGRTPAECYHPSPRRLPKELPPWNYPPLWLQRRVAPDGGLFWHGRYRFIGRAFGGEIIGLKTVQPGLWKIFLGKELLGVLYQKDRSRSLRPAHRAYH